MLTGYRRRQQAPPPLPPTIAALLRLRREGAGRDEMAFRLIDRTTDTIATATYEELCRRSARNPGDTSRDRAACKASYWSRGRAVMLRRFALMHRAPASL
jgi:hypothetical protein